jgi:hypothetical protein
VLNRFDGALELTHAVPVAGKERDCKRTHLFGDLLLQNGECGFTAGGDEHALAAREVMADDVGDGVRLAGPWRSLRWRFRLAAPCSAPRAVSR